MLVQLSIFLCFNEDQLFRCKFTKKVIKRWVIKRSKNVEKRHKYISFNGEKKENNLYNFFLVERFFFLENFSMDGIDPSFWLRGYDEQTGSRG